MYGDTAMKKGILISFALTTSISIHANANEYSFDWDDKNDMRGAWMMCATKGFSGSECRKVFRKCWRPPLIYKRKRKIKTHCTKPPSFSTSESDVTRASQYAEQQNFMPNMTHEQMKQFANEGVEQANSANYQEGLNQSNQNLDQAKQYLKAEEQQYIEKLNQYSDPNKYEPQANDSAINMDDILSQGQPDSGSVTIDYDELKNTTEQIDFNQ